MGLTTEQYAKWQYVDVVMSNLDHTIEPWAEDKLKGREAYAQYSGWNFCGYVYWLNNLWHCDVWRYNAYRETFRADSLQEIMDLVSDKYGYE